MRWLACIFDEPIDDAYYNSLFRNWERLVPGHAMEDLESCGTKHSMNGCIICKLCDL